VAHPQQLSISQSKEVFLAGFEEQQPSAEPGIFFVMGY
jgi:hypothetical protein